MVPHVVTVCRPPQARLLDDVAARLRTAGCEVVSFGAVESFPTDGSALADADVLVCSPALACTRALMSRAPRLRAVISPFIGVEGIDENAATELGILVANGQTSENAESMAEATILLMLAALYDLRHSEAVMRGEVSRPEESRALMLRGRTVGLIGYGNIARAITVRLGGWGARLFAWSRRPDRSAPVQWVELDSLLRESDIVCVLVSLNDGTRGLLDLARLRLMKPDALLVNTARGGIIDEDALVRVARERPAMRVALDVFATEPLPADSPLRELPNAILTPHMVGHTVESLGAIPGVTVDAALAVLRGEPPLHVRNPEAIPVWRQRWSRQ